MGINPVQDSIQVTGDGVRSLGLMSMFTLQCNLSHDAFDYTCPLPDRTKRYPQGVQISLHIQVPHAMFLFGGLGILYQLLPRCPNLFSFYRAGGGGGHSVPTFAKAPKYAKFAFREGGGVFCTNFCQGVQYCYVFFFFGVGALDPPSILQRGCL